MNSEPIVYTGGDFATNAYLIPNAAGTAYLCFDAPQGLAAEVKGRGLKIEALLLTHGHFDHLWDAGILEQEQGCPVYVHAADAPLVRDLSYLAILGIRAQFPLVKKIHDLPVPTKGSLDWEIGGRKWHLFHIPGHSFGSVAFYEAAEKRLFGGDILFTGGVGRWDLPGGSKTDLLSGISEHLLPLPEETIVYPGHGPATTIGVQKRDNPYLSPIS